MNDEENINAALQNRKITRKELQHESKITYLFAHILIMRANNVAQKKYNNIDMLPVHEQLNKSREIMLNFPNTKFVA